MIIDFVNANGGGGGGYVLPIASASVLGGVKVGSGLTIDNAGRLSTSGGSAAEDWTWYSMAEYEGMSLSDKNALFAEMAALYSAGTYTFGFLMDTEEGAPIQYPVWKYEDETQKLWFRAVYARCYNDDPEMGYAAVNAGVVIIEYGEEDAKYIDWGSDYGYAGEDFAGVVKVGSGLTIDDDGVLSVSGGSAGESNYVIVDALSAVTEPTEGLMAWVKTESAVSSTYKIYISDPNSWEGWDGDRPEGMLGHFTDGVNEDLNLYLSTDNFYWDWDNSGEWKTRDYYGSLIPYRTHNVDGTGGAWFETGELPKGITFEPASGVSNEAITAVTYSNGVSYVYRNGSWKKMNAVYFIDRNQFVDSAETVAFHDQLERDLDSGNLPVIFETQRGITLNYAGVEYNGLKFYGNIWNSAAQITIAGADGYFDSEGFNPAGIKWDEGAVADTNQSQHTINLTSGGTFDNPDQLGKFSEESHTDTIIFKMDGDYDVWSQAPVKYVYRTRSQEEDPLVYYWSVEIPVNGTLYRGVWHVTEGDWSNYTTDSWAAV